MSSRGSFEPMCSTRPVRRAEPGEKRSSSPGYSGRAGATSRTASAVACEPVRTTRGAAEAPPPEQRRDGVAARAARRARRRCRFCSIRCVGGSNIQTTNRPQPTSGSRSVHVSSTSTSRAARASPTCSHASVGRHVTRLASHLGQLLRVARVDDELEAPELRERSHGPALHARDALALGRDGGRVDPEPDHGSTERASVRASSPAPRRRRLQAQRRGAACAAPRASSPAS